MNKRTEKEELGLKPVIINYLLHWKLILGTAAVGLVLAVLYLLLFPRTYETTARVQIEDANNPLTATSASAMLGEATGLMKSFGLGAVGSGTVVIEDEVAHFLSNELLSQTAWELGLYADYTKPYTLGYRMYGEKPLV
ncbi:MAG: tyrosine protein kinase, partial [Tannerella sp.]|nr:tyrosine protein kinase [Tannerella sp.]